jgi:hypothetical protein
LISSRMNISDDDRRQAPSWTFPREKLGRELKQRVGTGRGRLGHAGGMRWEKIQASFRFSRSEAELPTDDATLQLPAGQSQGREGGTCHVGPGRTIALAKPWKPHSTTEHQTRRGRSDRCPFLPHSLAQVKKLLPHPRRWVGGTESDGAHAPWRRKEGGRGRAPEERKEWDDCEIEHSWDGFELVGSSSPSAALRQPPPAAESLCQLDQGHSFARRRAWPPGRALSSMGSPTAVLRHQDPRPRVVYRAHCPVRHTPLTASLQRVASKTLKSISPAALFRYLPVLFT